MAKIRTNIGLSDAQRDGAAKILNGILADEYVLYTKTRNFHWNVTGPEFDDLHKFFEGQYDQIDEMIDEIAERVRALGKTPVATLGEFLKVARLKESTKTLTAVQMVEKLLEDHDTLIRQLRDDQDKIANKFGDAGNQDSLIGWMKTHEKMAWMLRSIVEGWNA